MEKKCSIENCTDLNHSGSEYCYQHDPDISDRSKNIMNRLKPINERLAYVSELLDRKPSPVNDEQRSHFRKEEAELVKRQTSLTAQYRASRRKDVANV